MLEAVKEAGQRFSLPSSLTGARGSCRIKETALQACVGKKAFISLKPLSVELSVTMRRHHAPFSIYFSGLFLFSLLVWWSNLSCAMASKNGFASISPPKLAQEGAKEVAGIQVCLGSLLELAEVLVGDMSATGSCRARRKI